MSNRIQLLAEQAGVNLSAFQFPGTPIKYEVSESELKEFAELIVRECAAMTRNLSPHGELAERAVKEHFGVEE